MSNKIREEQDHDFGALYMRARTRASGWRIDLMMAGRWKKILQSQLPI
jgi:hypothetical protein